MNLKDKVGLVTGGAVRIGRALCEHLAAEGAHVVIHCHKSQEAARDLKSELGAAHGVQVEVVTGDLSDGACCERVVKETVERMGRLDVLVNNAAVFRKDALSALTGEKLLAEFQPNLFAPILLTRAFAERVKQGKIINILDRRIVTDDVSCVPYTLTKQALARFTRMAALDLAPGITVNAVAPGPVLPPPGASEGYLAEHGGPVPLEHACTMDDVAGAMLYLLNADAVTGQVVFVDGGQHLLGGVLE